MRNHQVLQLAITRRPRCAGFTLIEMLVVITLAGVVLTTAAALLGTMFRGDHASRAAILRHRTLARLDEQFRADVHAAKAFLPVKQDQPDRDQSLAGRWRFTLPDGRTVEYHMQDDLLVRVQRNGQRAEQRESYRLGPGLAVSAAEEPLEIAGQSKQTLIVLQIDHRSQTTPVTAVPLRIEAVLGRDLQMAHLGDQSGESP